MESNNTTTPIGSTDYDLEQGDFKDFHTNAGNIVALLITLLGTCENGLVIYVYVKSKSLLDSSLKAVINLAVTDLQTMAAFGVFSIIFLIDVHVSYTICLLTFTLPIYFTFVTQCVLAVSTVDRYIAICHSTKHAKMISTSFLNFMLVSSWVFPIPVALTPIFGFNYWSDIQTCIIRQLYHEWVVITQSITFIVIMILTTSLYLLILRKAIKFHLKIKPAQSHEMNAGIMQKKKSFRKAIFLGILTLLFIVCNLPFAIVRFHFGREYFGHSTTIHGTFLLGIINGIANPFLYVWQNPKFRSEAIRVLGCKSCVTKSRNQPISGEAQLTQGNVASMPKPALTNNPGNSNPHRDMKKRIEIETIHENSSSGNGVPKTLRSKLFNVKPIIESIA